MAMTAQDTMQKPGYKQSEVGVIPEDWKVKKLEELATWKGGATPSMANPSFWINGTVYWASSGDIKTKILSKTASMITEIAVKQSSTTLLQEGAILIVTRSGILRKYLPVAKNTVPIAINQDIKALILNNHVSADYLLQVLSEYGPDILSTCMKTGTTVESIEYAWLKNYQIPLPSLPEQQAIATTLSDVDALITSLDQLIAKKRDIKQATMQQLLTGKTRLPGLSGEWETEKLGEITEVVMGQSPVGASYNRDGYGYPLINGPTEFTDRYPIKIQWTNQPTKFCKKNDILLCVRGSSTGRINIANDDYCIGRGIAAIRAKAGVDAHYITFQVDCAVKNILALTTGSTFPNIDGKSIRSIEFPLPTFSEQTAIATVLSDMDAEIAALEQKRDKTRALKQGMMQELLTGKTRLL
jgi:type I restriction enzyme S subunit